ncbi:hypothetical protein [Bacillus safensis]
MLKLKAKMIVPVVVIVALALPILHSATTSYQVADKVITSSIGKDAKKI